MPKLVKITTLILKTLQHNLLIIRSVIACYSIYAGLTLFIQDSSNIRIGIAMLFLPFSWLANLATYIPNTITHQGRTRPRQSKNIGFARATAFLHSIVCTCLYSSTLRKKVHAALTVTLAIPFQISLCIAMNNKISSLWESPISIPKNKVLSYVKLIIDIISTIFFCLTNWLATENMLKEQLIVTEPSYQLPIQIPLLLANIFANLGYLLFEIEKSTQIFPQEAINNNQASTGLQRQTR